MVDVIVLGIILIIVFLIVRSFIKDKAKGTSGCGCGCSTCSMAGQCHSDLKK